VSRHSVIYQHPVPVPLGSLGDRDGEGKHFFRSGFRSLCPHAPSDPGRRRFFVDGTQPQIEVRDLHFSYRGDGSEAVDALRGVSFSLRPGEFVALVGANGSGKTTLARHLNALLVPERGEVRVSGLSTHDRASWPIIRSQVTMVFQRPEDQIVATVVEDDVAFGPENLGLPGEEIERRVRWALEKAGVWHLRHRPPHLLSAGQQQRVAIAGALAMSPRCLVLDEATAMLDPAGRREILALLHQLHVEGMTVVLITHLMREAVEAERIIALEEGRVAFDGPCRPFFADSERLALLGLEVPALRALSTELARQWPAFPGDLLTADELVEALLPRLRRAGAASRSEVDPCGARAEAAHEPALVEVQGVHHTYLEGTPLAAVSLGGVTLDVCPGEIVALLGPTGSGKSTLLQLVAGLLRPRAGQVYVHLDGGTDGLAGRKGMSMLFQRPEEQLFETYVGDDVAFGPRQLGLDQGVVRERVRWAMEMVGLPFLAYKDRFTQGLSGGERRKAGLAGVLALRPALLLLDEPTSGLDPQSRHALVDTLRRLNREEGMTLLMVTHAMEEVVALAHRAVVLDEGQVVAQGMPRRLFSEPALLARHGLEPPAIAALMHKLGAAGAAVRADVMTVDEAVLALSAGAAEGPEWRA
jgi:energy-coupling factor transporter ATPase